MAEERTKREEIAEYINFKLGGGVVDVYMTSAQIDSAINRAFRVYRQRAENSMEESYVIFTLKAATQSYILPKEILEVRQIFRRGFSQSASKGSEIDPFSIAYTNVYLLQAGRSGGLLTYELYSSYMETAGKMFGMHINFSWESRSRKLTIMQLPRADEEVILWCWNSVPNEVLLDDQYARPWIEDWALAEAKEIEGQIRSKFSQIAGPQGGTTLNGNDLLAQAAETKEKLLEDLKNFVDGSTPLGWIHG
jgi:hypothetical protein